MYLKRIKNIFRSFPAILTLFFVIWGARVNAAEPVIVYATASTTNAITEITALFQHMTKAAVTPSFGSSSALAKQIENGAPAALFLSADQKWMDYLEEKKLIESATRLNLLGNRLVLIAPRENGVSIDIKPGFDLAGVLGDNRLAMGDPAHVPVGIYGRAALEKLGVWEKIKNQIARAGDVRSALVLVERGESPLGVVYATDAAVSEKVRVVGIFPENTHPPISYPVAMVAGNQSRVAAAFFNFLKSSEAKAVFKKYGFSVN